MSKPRQVVLIDGPFMGAIVAWSGVGYAIELMVPDGPPYAYWKVGDAVKPDAFLGRVVRYRLCQVHAPGDVLVGVSEGFA